MKFRKTMKKVFEIFEKALEASRIPGREAHAVCYTCKSLIRRDQFLFYAPPLGKDYWCECCGTKIRVDEKGLHQCNFFRGLKPGEID